MFKDRLMGVIHVHSTQPAPPPFSSWNSAGFPLIFFTYYTRESLAGNGTASVLWSDVLPVTQPTASAHLTELKNAIYQNSGLVCFPPDGIPSGKREICQGDSMGFNGDWMSCHGMSVEFHVFCQAWKFRGVFHMESHASVRRKFHVFSHWIRREHKTGTAVLQGCPQNIDPNQKGVRAFLIHHWLGVMDWGGGLTLTINNAVVSDLQH